MDDSPEAESIEAQRLDSRASVNHIACECTHDGPDFASDAVVVVVDLTRRVASESFVKVCECLGIRLAELPR